MKRIATLSVIFALALVGCVLETEDPEFTPVSPTNHMVINEVFTLPITHAATYSWIELFNPTADTVDLTNWTLSYSTYRASTNIIVTVDTFGNFVPLQFVTLVDTFGMFDVPFAEGTFDIPGVEEDTVKLSPNGLFTIVSNEDRLLDHTDWGPGDERFARERGAIQGPIDGITIIDSSDTLITFQVTAKSYGVFFQGTEQIVLKDPSGNVVDVVRYGDYTYSGPVLNDPYPDNMTIGVVPEFQSIQRYTQRYGGGAYSTGNSSSDFYISTSSVPPTPHWYNQQYKR